MRAVGSVVGGREVVGRCDLAILEFWTCPNQILARFGGSCDVEFYRESVS
jgi:hypothetical protein